MARKGREITGGKQRERKTKGRICEGMRSRESLES